MIRQTFFFRQIVSLANFNFALPPVDEREGNIFHTVHLHPASITLK